MQLNYDLLSLPNDIEPFFDQYQLILKELNGIVNSQQTTLEGNIFYLDGDFDKKMLFKPFRTKRRNLAIFATVCEAIVEIGFNAGHSALLALTANNRLLYRGIDINYHPYVKPCFEYLQKHFSNRIAISYGDSQTIVPNIKKIYPELNALKVGWIIDGDHNVEVAHNDIQNVLTQANTKDVIMFDDADMPVLRNLITAWAMSGKIKILHDLGYLVLFKAT